MTEIRVMIYEPADNTLRTGGEELLAERPKADGAWIWVDLKSPPPDAESTLLRDNFAVGRLALLDAQRPRHPPKVEVFDDYVFLLLKELTTGQVDIETPEITQTAVFMGINWLATRRSKQSRSLDQTWQAAIDGQIELVRGPAHLVYRICRHVSDDYTPIVLQLEERLTLLEEEMFARPSDAVLEKLSRHNRLLKLLRRIFTYQYGMMSRMARDEGDLTRLFDEHEFNDLYENLERLASLSQMNQELAVDLQNTYLSLSSHRLNEIMRVLTIATVIFLPLGLMAGIYGMNFDIMPELKWRYGYFMVLGGMFTLVTTLIVTFRRVRWL